MQQAEHSEADIGRADGVDAAHRHDSAKGQRAGKISAERAETLLAWRLAHPAGLADASVDRLAQQVGMTGMACRLLDQM